MHRFNRGDNDDPPLPKPYAFVSIPEARMDPKHPIGHDTYRTDLITGAITGILVALSPVHVASGNIELTGRQPSLVKAHFRRNDRPTIPGSSLKGVVRSIVEAISDPPSCLRVTQARFDNIPVNVKRCSRKESLCVACRMFGAMDYWGQVSFADALLVNGGTEIIQIPSLFQPRTRERVYFDKGRVKGRKFYMHGQDGRTARGNVPVEACPVGSRFQLSVRFENLDHGQLALLLTALGQGNPGLTPKLGGAKPACCGSLEITNVTVTTIPVRQSALEFESESSTETLESLLKITDSINRESLSRLANILEYHGENSCPDRNY
jgi:CRISPR-associated protein Csm3